MLGALYSQGTRVTYDLLLKGGHVIDPAEGHDGVADVAFKDGKVAVVAGRLSDGEAAEVRSAEGLYVVPGLIDLHTHVYWAARSMASIPTGSPRLPA
jgi:dihydroorotase